MLDRAIADDFSTIVDWLKPIYLDGVRIERSLRRAISTREAAASTGRFTNRDTVFHLDMGEYATEPPLGSRIKDEDGAWTIIEVARHTLSNRWRCVTRRLKIERGVLVSILRAEFSKGSTGAHEPVWSTIASDVKVHIERDRESVVLEHEHQASRQFAAVHFEAPIELKVNDRLQSPANVQYRVEQWRGWDDIAQLFVADCERLSFATAVEEGVGG